MLNTDLHKSESSNKKSQKKMTKAEFINNLKLAIQSDDLSTEHLSVIYDVIEETPIAMHQEAEDSVQNTRQHCLDDMFKNVRASDSLLRGLSVHDFKFATIDDFTISLDYSKQDALADLACSCVSKTWYQVHGAVNTCLEIAYLDPQGMEPAVDILLYALAVTICLDMPIERSAFLGQLVRLRSFEDRRQGRIGTSPATSLQEEEWYQELEEACSGLHDSKLWALKKIHSWVESLKAALLVDVQNKVELSEAVGELVHGDYLLQDPARAFLQSEDLIKKSSRTGRTAVYRFYLFSDVLLYASKEPAGCFKIHEEFPLHLMKIVDWFPPTQKNRLIMFEVHHPRKSFEVLCPTHEVCKRWVENIRAGIMLELERKMILEAARLSTSTVGRLS
jgi:Sec7 domain